MPGWGGGGADFRNVSVTGVYRYSTGQTMETVRKDDSAGPIVLKVTLTCDKNPWMWPFEVSCDAPSDVMNNTGVKISGPYPLTARNLESSAVVALREWEQHKDDPDPLADWDPDAHPRRLLGPDDHLPDLLSVNSRRRVRFFTRSQRHPVRIDGEGAAELAEHRPGAGVGRGHPPPRGGPLGLVAVRGPAVRAGRQFSVHRERQSGCLRRQAGALPTPGQARERAVVVDVEILLDRPAPGEHPASGTVQRHLGRHAKGRLQEEDHRDGYSRARSASCRRRPR